MKQAEHYDRILVDYEAHYYDETSMEYRRRYIYPRLFAGMDLDGKRVYELACGSGSNTNELLRLFPRAQVTGLDISPRSCEAYRRNTGRDALVYDLTARDAQPLEPADFAVVIGGLHHCVTDLSSTFANLSRLVAPGGHLAMVEPNAGYFLNTLRDRWYRTDHWFQAEEEAPLHHDAIAHMAQDYFEPLVIDYLGGPAYFLVLNSLIVRFPVRAKKIIAPIAFLMDDIYNRLPGRRMYPMFIARWRRHEGGRR